MNTPTSPPRVVVVGSINHDSFITLNRPPIPGETITGLTHHWSLGGKGANQAIAAAKAGAQVTMIGAVGNDPTGDQLISTLNGNAINTEHVTRVHGTGSGLAHIHVAHDAQNSIVLSPGANAHLTALTHAMAGAIKSADVLLLQLEIPMVTVMEAARVAHSAGVPVILTPAPAVPLDDGLLDLVTIIVPNEVEITQITGDTNPNQAIRTLTKHGVNVLNTMGAHGSTWHDVDGTHHHVDSRPVTAIDTTGAGDCYIGNFATHWAQHASVPQAMHWATAAAALCVQRHGASPSMPHRRQVLDLCDAN